MAQEHPANHLAKETSPYLLQHAHNPVDWFPWGKEALAKAKAEDLPIFLSIGYSACHWCHVMERESFENEEIAAFLNAHFVSIKVDREERPDLDDLYMAAVQRMTGAGGWPMSVFLTPELKPFYGGTYFPPQAKFGKPGFLDLLHGIENAWLTKREDINRSADQLGDSLQIQLPPAPEEGLPTAHDLARMEMRWAKAFLQSFDSQWGGFSPAPKFPHTEDLRLLLAAVDRQDLPKVKQAVAFTLHRMADGGMYDQLAGGFARYSVDDQWLIPHFEKMLYDQGTLIPTYLDAWRSTGDLFFHRIATETCDFLLREMRDPKGGFWSSMDADSEGVEGKFFVWTPNELREILGEKDGVWAAKLLGVTAHGNFEHGYSALTLRSGLEEKDSKRWQSVRKRMWAVRNKRIPPATDDKVLTAWNGLAIAALARAGRELGEPRFVDAAANAGRFLLAEMRTSEGRWLRSWRKGTAQHDAILEDHAYLCRGFLELFQATGNEIWLTEAAALADIMLAEYSDEKTAIFWDTDGKDPLLLHRRSSPWDGAIPSANAVALESLALLHAFTQEERWYEPMRRGYAAVLALALPRPRGFSGSLRGLALAVSEPKVAVVVGTDSDSLDAWRTALHQPGSPSVLVVLKSKPDPKSKLSLFSKRPPQNKKTTLYLCEGATCLPPETNPDKWPGLLQNFSRE